MRSLPVQNRIQVLDRSLAKKAKWKDGIRVMQVRHMEVHLIMAGMAVAQVDLDLAGPVRTIAHQRQN